MRTSYNTHTKHNEITRIILIILAVILIAGSVPAVNGSYAYAESGIVESDIGYYDYDSANYMLTLVNDERAAYGLSPLEMDVIMLDAAMTRAYECTYYFSHYRPDGGDASTLDSRIYSENISWGMSAEGTMSGWMDSFAHRDNILDPGYESVGVGSFVTYDGTPYWVLVFSYEYAIKHGWEEDANGMAYYSYGEMLRSQWVEYDGEMVYLKDDGYMATDEWVKDSKGMMWVDSNGKIVKSRWLQYGDNWYYLKSDGYVATGLQKLDIEQYKYDDSGNRINYRNIRYRE
jgi:hypothetical protein